MITKSNCHLISFLGTGNYAPASYPRYAGIAELKTPWVALALARMLPAARIDIVATEQAQALHGDDLGQALHEKGLPAPRFHTIRAGRQQDALWQQFNVISELLRAPVDDAVPVVLDITHGFRAQPFFAGATLGLLGAIEQLPAQLSVVYAEHDRATAQSTIWNLDLFVELLQWAQALGLFMRTGLADPVIQLGRKARERGASIARQTGTAFPTFNRLVGAIEAFADDLATVRIASLITGYTQDKQQTSMQLQSSSSNLLAAIDQCRSDVEQHIPPLAMVLDSLQQSVRPMQSVSLFGTSGQQAMQALARHYLQLERYPEAAIVAREASICAYAQDRAAVDVAVPAYKQNLRRETEHRCKKHETNYATIAEIRNDIQHGGFNEQPLDAKTLKSRVSELVDNITLPVLHQAAEKAKTGSLILISRHPGAQQWLASQAIVVDHVQHHLQLDELAPHDIVIGNLPMHLAAALDERGIAFYNLVLDINADMRGRELGLAELQQCNPRLRRYRVQDIGAFPASYRHR